MSRMSRMSRIHNRHAPCPQCGREIELTLAALLQCEQLGVSCDCSHCGREWILHVDAPQSAPNAPHLPVLERASVAPSVQHRPATPTVFIVDGRSDIGDSLRFLVEAEGWNVETYFSAEDFLHAYDPSSPGCLISELDLPGMGGLELQQRLIQISPTLPVIFLTVRGDMAHVVKSLYCGALDHFEKPVDPALLLERIRDAIREDTRRRETGTLGPPSISTVPRDLRVDHDRGATTGRGTFP